MNHQRSELTNQSKLQLVKDQIGLDPVDYIKDGIVSSEMLNEKSTFVVCSYYWGRENVSKNSIKGLKYGEYADRLIKNCQDLKINYYVEEFPIFAEKKIYQLALALKGHFIKKCLDLFPNKKVIFLDVDLQILQYPELFEIDADVFLLNWNEYDYDCYNPYQVQLPGAILGFSNSYNSRTMLDYLNEFMIKRLHLAEDRAYSAIISRHFINTFVRCVWLPESYMFMFTNHIYDQELNKYTVVNPLEKQLSEHPYKKNDIVIIHEDFETAELSNVYNQKVTRNRILPNEDRLRGEKLRCIKTKYLNYTNYNLSNIQYKHFKPDFDDKQKEEIYKNVSLKPITYKEYTIYDSKIENENYIIVSNIYKDTPDEIVKEFIKRCEKFNMNYIIYGTTEEINQPQLFYQVLSKYKRKIIYLDIYSKIKKYPKLFDVKNMDFMTVNLDQTNVVGPICSDPRILRTLNDNLYLFDYNNVVLQFLQIWCEHNHNLKKHNQHKTLEYAFNISLSVNKLRCYWFPKEYTIGPIITFDNDRLFDFFNNKYIKVSLDIAKKLERCGLSPSLDDDEPIREHHFATPKNKGTQYKNQFGLRFLEF